MLATTLRSSTCLVLGMMLLTSITGCSGCQQQTPLDTTSTEEVESDSAEASTSSSESTETPKADAENSSKPDDAEPVSKETTTEAKTASDSTQDVSNTQPARREAEGGSPASPATAPAMSSSEALAKARTLYASAKSGKQDPGQSFQDASKAWELLNQHPDNAECQAMAAEISKSLGSMATKANQKYSSELSSDPVLIEK